MRLQAKNHQVYGAAILVYPSNTHNTFRTGGKFAYVEQLFVLFVVGLTDFVLYH